MNALKSLSLVALLAAGTTGCQNRLYTENQELFRQNRELQSKLDATEADKRRMADPAQLAAMQSSLAERDKDLADRDARLAELQEQLRKQPENQPADPGLAGIDASYNKSTGQLTVDVPGDVLFASGQAEIKPSAQATLDKIVAAVRKDYAGRRVFVDGYSDSDPITRSKDKWEDNLDLSAARARSVAKYLTGHGLAAGLVAPRAMGSTAPKASKDKSRRVEIVVQVR